jgi:hypothetical protein
MQPMARPKRIDASELRELVPDENSKWERRQGLKDAIPREIRRMPDEKFYHATVSGSIESPRTETKYGVTGDVVAGVDAWRCDAKDAERHGINFNKEHHFITRTGTSPDFEYWLHGPFTRNETDHWQKEIPDEYADCEVLVSRRSST